MRPSETSSGPFALSVWTDVRPAPSDSNWRRRYEELLEEARLADSLGFRGFWTTEQHAVDDGYLGAQLAVLAGIATVTSRVRLMTNVLLLPLYRWRQVVEQAVVVDLLSGGRLELGVGLGEFTREFELFSVDRRKRGELMEQAIPFVRQGLVEGHLPDGPGGALLPVTPRPVQARIPILVGGHAPAAVDRAVRLGDGCLPVSHEQPEENLPRFWENVLRPSLERHGRSPSNFRIVTGVALWVTEDPERDWETLLKPAFTYQQRRYLEWSGQESVPRRLARELRREDAFIDTPEGVARRLLATWSRMSWHELGFWYRLPGIPHQRALAHLEMVARRLVPLLAAH